MILKNFKKIIKFIKKNVISPVTSDETLKTAEKYEITANRTTPNLKNILNYNFLFFSEFFTHVFPVNFFLAFLYYYLCEY